MSLPYIEKIMQKVLFIKILRNLPFCLGGEVGFCFFRVLTVLERASHNGEQEGKELERGEILMTLLSLNFHHSRPLPKRPSTTSCLQVLCIETSISSARLFQEKTSAAHGRNSQLLVDGDIL
jgi:hypothetical protein